MDIVLEIRDKHTAGLLLCISGVFQVMALLITVTSVHNIQLLPHLILPLSVLFHTHRDNSQLKAHSHRTLFPGVRCAKSFSLGWILVFFKCAIHNDQFSSDFLENSFEKMGATPTSKNLSRERKN